MPKHRKPRGNRATATPPATANTTGPGSSTPRSSAVPSNNLYVNYTAMPTESLRLLLSQRSLNQTGPRRDLVARLKESDASSANAAPPVPDQLSALIASIVEEKLANISNKTPRGPSTQRVTQHADTHANIHAVDVDTEQAADPLVPLLLHRSHLMADELLSQQPKPG